MLAQDLLIIVRTILAATVRVMNTAFRRCPECNRHLQRPDRQVPFHAIAYSPTNDTPRMQVQDHGQIQPTLAGPNAADIARPFLGWLLSAKITVQQVWRDIKLMITVRRDLVFAGSNHGYAVLAASNRDRSSERLDLDKPGFYEAPALFVGTYNSMRINRGGNLWPLRFGHQSG